MACRHASAWQQVNFYVCVYVLFPGGLLSLPLLIWRACKVWSSPGDHGGSFGLLCGAVFAAGYYACWPLLFRRKIARLYDQQQLDREWELEFSDDCVRSKLLGLAESRLEWPYFQTFVETSDIFLLLRTRRLAFVTVSKASLDESQQAELRTLLKKHLEQVGQ
jgi:hypothetical protein